MLCGGQGLRGKDAHQHCCIPRLRDGILASETLHHVCFVCPAYANIRCNIDFSSVTDRRHPSIFCLDVSYTYFSYRLAAVVPRGGFPLGERAPPFGRPSGGIGFLSFLGFLGSKKGNNNCNKELVTSMTLSSMQLAFEGASN